MWINLILKQSYFPTHSTGYSIINYQQYLHLDIWASYYFTLAVVAHKSRHLTHFNYPLFNFLKFFNRSIFFQLGDHLFLSRRYGHSDRIKFQTNGFPVGL